MAFNLRQKGYNGRRSDQISVRQGQEPEATVGAGFNFKTGVLKIVKDFLQY